MASKIYKKGVFLVIEDTVSGNLKEFNTADVQIVKKNANLDQYEILVLGVSQLKVNLADIKDEAGSAYSENDWDVFRFNSVGVTSQGGSAASGVSYDGTTSGLAATDVQAAIDEVAPIYSVYTAILNQSGTGAPVATVLENTLGGNIVWSYNSVGSYTGTLSNAFTANKTILFTSQNYASGGDITYAYVTSVNDVSIETMDSTGTNANDILVPAFIEIRVYA